MSKKDFGVVDHYRALKREKTAKRLGVKSKLFEANNTGTVYGDSAKQEVGHDAKQGSQKAMQSIDDPKNGSAASPNLVKKGSNSHKEDGMLEEVEELEEGGWGSPEMLADVPDEASPEEARAALEKAYNLYKNRSGRLNQQIAAQLKQALSQLGTEDAGVALNEAVNRLVKTISKIRRG